LDANFDADVNDKLTVPPTNEADEGTGTLMTATPNDETEDGFASIRDFKVVEAREDQCSDLVMGMSRETLMFENFSMIKHGESKKWQVSNIL
jgi:hypothetical protein